MQSAASCDAFTEQTLFTIWRIRAINFWKLESTLVHRVTWRSSWEIIADTNCRCLSDLAESLRAAMEYLQELRNEYKDNFISVGPLIVSVCTLNDATLVRLDSSSVHITMTETTLRRMFDFDGCIDVTFERLARLVDTVDAKYTRFSNITSETPYATASSSRDVNSSIASY